MDFSLTPISTSTNVAFSLTIYTMTAAGKASNIMSKSNIFSHLTLEERRIILTGITNGSTKTAIAKTIGKDKSTVGKEIKLRRTLTYKCKLPLECNNYRTCHWLVENSNARLKM